jgi:hypothetical protein
LPEEGTAGCVCLGIVAQDSPYPNTEIGRYVFASFQVLQQFAGKA